MSTPIERYLKTTRLAINEETDQDFTQKILEIMADADMSNVRTIEQYMTKIRNKVNEAMDEHILTRTSGSSYAAIILRYGSEKHIRRTIERHAPGIYTILQREKYEKKSDEPSSTQHSKHAYEETYYNNGEISVGEIKECPLDTCSNRSETTHKDTYKLVFTTHDLAAESRKIAMEQAEKENQALKSDPQAYDFTK